MAIATFQNSAVMPRKQGFIDVLAEDPSCLVPSLNGAILSQNL
jgi:hypothetical protein